MKKIIQFSFFLCLASYCLGQKTIDFEYFRRAGRVDVSLYVKTPQKKSFIPYSRSIVLENTSEEQFFIIELSNLKLGLDKETGSIKQEKDTESYSLLVSQDPSAITMSTEALQFHSITNGGLLSDQSTSNANKKISIYYAFHNLTSADVISDIQIKFNVESNPGFRPIKEEHKGGDLLKYNITVKSNQKYQQQISLSKKENEIYSNFVSSNQKAYKIKFAQLYVQHFLGANEQRTIEIQEYLSTVNQFINPINHDKEIFKKIIQFCVNERELNRCHTLCTEYQDLVWDSPNNYAGNYLERAFFYRIELYSETPNLQWLEWCKKYLQKFPSASESPKVRAYISEYESELESQKKAARNSFTQPSFGGQNYFSTQEKEGIDTEDFVEIEDIKLPTKEDWASIFPFNDNSGVTIRTGGISSEGYVVEFKDMSDQRIKYDPSFLGEKISITLDEALEGKLSSGKYKISVYSKINRQLLASNTIKYRSTSIPAELRYIFMVGCIALGFISYKKYFKL